MEIKRLGSYQHVDADGHLIKLAHAANFQESWHAPIKEVGEAYRARFGSAIHSVYIRGSLAKGQAQPGVSDVDSLAVFHAQRFEDGDTSRWAEQVESDVMARHPHVTGVELRRVRFEHASRHECLDAFIIKNEAVCIYGEDLAASLAPYSIGPEIAFQTRAFGQHLAVFRDEYPARGDAGKIELLVWITRRMLRFGMQLVMVAEQRYTRDLYLCYESFAKHYPAQQGPMYRTLELAVNPELGPRTEAFVLEFGGWLHQQVA